MIRWVVYIAKVSWSLSSCGVEVYGREAISGVWQKKLSLISGRGELTSSSSSLYSVELPSFLDSVKGVWLSSFSLDSGRDEFTELV